MKDEITTKELLIKLGYSEVIADVVYSHLESNSLTENDKK